MNIFVLDLNPRKAAEYHMDVHVVKMTVESLQMLSTAARYFNVPSSSGLYESSYENHPCNLWLRESFSNVLWLYDLFLSLLEEYTFRYKKIIKCSQLKNRLATCLEELKEILPDKGLTTFAQAMPEEYKHSNAVVAYRLYYVCSKSQLSRAGWKKGRNAPRWYRHPHQRYKHAA